jgi:hypothetical protein
MELLFNLNQLFCDHHSKEKTYPIQPFHYPKINKKRMGIQSVLALCQNMKNKVYGNNG